MEHNDWLITGTKLLGAYCVFCGFDSVARCITYLIGVSNMNLEGNHALTYLSYAVYPVVHFALAYVFICKGQWFYQKVEGIGKGSANQSFDADFSQEGGLSATSKEQNED